MKTILKKQFILIFSILIGLYTNGSSQNTVKQLIKKNEAYLGTYSYDGYYNTNIIKENRGGKVEFEMETFPGVSYKLLFCSAGLNSPIQINIFKMDETTRKRIKVYDNDASINNPYWVFQPNNTGTYYIEYSLPTSTSEKDTKANVVMLIGANL